MATTTATLGSLHKCFSVSTIVVLSLASCATNNCQPETVLTGLPSRPNILVICVDSVRPDYFNGTHFQRVWKQRRYSVSFQNAYANAPWTIPSVASIFTGLYPSRLGLNVEGVPGPGVWADDDIESLATGLSRNGYHTGAISPVIGLLVRLGLAKGFMEIIEPRPHTGGSSITLELMSRFKKPWFIWVHMFEAHWPYPHNSYERGLSVLDAEIARILASVDHETVVVLLSDHGEQLPPPEGQSGHGYDLTEAQLRTVLMFDFPFADERSCSSESRMTIVQLADVAPTIFDLVRMPFEADLDGVSLSRVICGLEVGPRPVISEAPYHGSRWISLRSGPWTLIWRPRVRGEVAWWVEYVEDYPGLAIWKAGDKVDTAPVREIGYLFEHMSRAYSGGKQSVNVSDSTSGLTPHEIDRLSSLGYVGPN